MTSMHASVLGLPSHRQSKVPYDPSLPTIVWILKFATLTSILLASGVLAVPSSRLDARLARRRENRQFKPINITNGPDGAIYDTQYSNNWAGAACQSQSSGTFNTVSGVFTVPTPNGPDGSAAVWVGIDGNGCNQALFQTGIIFRVSDGEVLYDAWYEWFPDYAHYYGNFAISAGDEISLAVSASPDATGGTAVIRNLSTGQMIIEELASSYSLCMQDAEWIVEDYNEEGSRVPFVNFGTVTFTNAIATGPGGSCTPDGATIIDLQQNGVVITSVSTSGETVTISYV